MATFNSPLDQTQTTGRRFFSLLMIWRIEIANKPGVVDPVGEGVTQDIADLGLTGVDRVRFIRLYELDGTLSKDDAHRIAHELLVDPVTQDARCTQETTVEAPPGQWGVEVRYRPGVTDAAGETTLKGIRDMGIQGVAASTTGRAYVIAGPVSESDVDTVCRRLLANDIIEEYRYYRT